MNSETTLHTKYSSDEEENDEHINYARIQFNELVWDALVASKNNETQVAIQKYESALKLIEPTNDLEKICLVKSNLAILQFHQGEFKKALGTLLECQESMKDLQRFKQNLSDSASSLMIKILGNLCLINLFLSNCEKAKEYANEFLSVISMTKETKKKLLIEDLHQIFFKYRSSEEVGENYFENMESKFKGDALGCYYLMMGLSKEISNELKLALQYYEKSYQVWFGLRDRAFLLLAARHVFGLAHQINDEEKVNEYKTMIYKILKEDQFKNISMDMLFKGFEEKIATTRDIANSLKKLEESLGTGIIMMRQESMRKSVTLKLDSLNINGEPTWKQAVRLKLLSSVKLATQLRESTSPQDQEKARHIDIAIDQMKRVVELISRENDPGMEEKLMNMSFVKEAVNSVRASVNRIRKFCLNQTYITAWKQLLVQKESKNRQSLLNKFKNRESSLTSISLKKVMDGEYLEKVNFHSSGKAKRYFKLCQDNTLRWSHKESDIKNPKKYNAHHLSEILGIVYGKVTDTMIKSSNSKLLPWLCFSIVLKNRSLDIYAGPDQINHWVIGLSHEVKHQNPRAFVISLGSFYWMKLKIMGLQKINQFMKLDKKKRHKTFVKALCAFKKSTMGKDT